MLRILAPTLLLAACAAVGPGRAPAPGGADVAETELAETVVSATRTPRADLETPRFTSRLAGEEIVRRQARTTPEAIQEEPGILVQETNLGGGSPFIRGLTGNQILVLIDGVRVNNAAFSRFGPNQYLNTIDPFSLESIEVVRGPNSLQYGSDAIGGVVAMRTRARDPSADGAAMAHEIETFLRYGSAAREKTVAVRGEGSSERWSAAGGFLLQDFEDLRGGRDTGVQSPTGYDAGAGDLKIGWRAGEDHVLTAAYQIFQANHVPRTDRITSGANLVYEFDPQRRQLAYLKWDGRFDGALDEAHATVSYHRQEEGRTEVRASAPDTTRRLEDAVDTLGGSAHAVKRLGNHRVTAGFEVYDDTVSSSRVDTTTGQPPQERAGRLPDGSGYTSLGVYAQDEVDIGERVSLIGGLRWSYFEWDAVLTDPAGPFSGSADDVTWQLGATVLAADGIRPYASVATGFRAPNLDDLTIRDSFGGGIEVPNSELDPESSVNYELGVKVRRDGFRVTAAGFYTDLQDLIQRVPTGGTVDGEPEFTRENVGEARLYGFEMEAAWRIPATRWTLAGNLAWARGDDRTTGTPLTRIPPLLGRLGLRYDDAGGHWYAEGFTRFADRQDRLSPSDIADPRVPEGGTPGWATFNLRGGITVTDRIRVEAALENLFDLSYRLHGSGIDAPGTNFVLTLIGSF